LNKKLHSIIEGRSIFPSLGSFGNGSVNKEGGIEAKNMKKEVLKWE
jgi:hypothetical protein